MKDSVTTLKEGQRIRVVASGGFHARRGKFIKINRQGYAVLLLDGNRSQTSIHPSYVRDENDN